jgi:outer membrane protein TolC
MKRFGAALCAAGITACAAWSDGGLTLAELTKLASTGNLDLRNARSALETARTALAGESLLSSARVSLSGSWSAGSSAGPGQSSPLSAQVQVSVPVLPQLSVGASVSSQGTGSVSLSLYPFASGTATYSQKETFRKAALQAAYQAAKLGYDVESAAYAFLEAQEEVTAAEAAAVLQGEVAGVRQKAYELGGITFTELQSARAAMTIARQAVFDAQRSFITARVALYRQLGPASGEQVPAGVTVAQLLAAVASRDGEIAKLANPASASLSLRSLQIELDALKEQLAATPVYTPSLSVSADVSFPLSGSAGVSFSFSPSEIRTDDRARIAQSIIQKQAEIEIETLSVRLQSQVLVQALAMARSALESRQAEVTQAETSLAESKVLLSQGQVTSLETRQAELDLRSSQARLFAAAVSVLRAQADILLASML